MAAAAAVATNGDIPEDANESMSSQKISETLLEKHTQKIAMAAAAAATNDDIPEDANENCPGPQAESAGKADACAGCPNQEICAPAPKGPDRGEMPRGAGDYHPTASIRRRYDAERESVRAARLEQLERDNPTAHALFTDEIHPAAVPDDDDGGPYDTTLLRSFSNHIARKIWDDPTNARGVLDSKYHYNTLHRNWPIRELLKDVAQMVYSTSFKTIVNYSYEHIDMALVSAFVERWQPETNTFHLPFGEMTITLDDVKQILDMPVMGTPLHLAPGSKWPDNDDEEIDWSSLMSKGIGVQGDTDYKALHGDGDCIKMSKLREYFINTNLTDAQKSSHAYKLKEFRAWMVYMCGSLVFPNKSGGKVNAKLMYYVMHPDHVDDYAWGVAILAFLYRELGKASRASCAQIAGCLPLLLCWIWEHFPNLKRPTWDSRYLENEPRLKRWLPTQNPGSHHESLIAYRHEIDEMDKDDVIWDPYKEQRADSRPLALEAWYAGLLVYSDILEAYYPDRVLRQFGLVQTIPRMPYNAPINATRGRRGRYELSYRFLVDQLVNWPTHVLAVPSRSTPSEYQSEVDPGYMEWFYTFSHPRVHRGELRSRLPMPDRGSEEEMHTMAVAMKRARTSMANMKDADTNTGSGKAKRTLNKLGKLFGFACEGNMVNTHKHLKDMEDTRRYY